MPAARSPPPPAPTPPAAVAGHPPPPPRRATERHPRGPRRRERPPDHYGRHHCCRVSPSPCTSGPCAPRPPRRWLCAPAPATPSRSARTSPYRPRPGAPGHGHRPLLPALAQHHVLSRAPGTPDARDQDQRRDRTHRREPPEPQRRMVLRREPRCAATAGMAAILGHGCAPGQLRSVPVGDKSAVVRQIPPPQITPAPPRRAAQELYVPCARSSPSITRHSTASEARSTK